jgi:hypothetical protein
MLVAMRALLLIVLLGCSGSQRGGPGSPDELGCRQDPAARATCEAQGSGFEPDFGCTGTDPGPEGRAEIKAAREAHPCACMTRVDYDQRQHDCMIMP